MLNSMLSYIKDKIKRQYSSINGYQSLIRLHQQGFSPNVVLDVGAHTGEFASMAHKIWPSATVYSFEVLPHALQVLQRFPYIVPVPSLVGEEDREAVVFNVAETASSILTENIDQHFPTESFSMLKLDTFCQNKSLTPNFLKIDTQGYEYQVISGGLGMLKNVDFVLAELNFLDIHKGVRLAPEVIQLLWEQGFVPYDITELHRRPLDKAIWQVDFLFCRLNHPLRSDKRWNK